MATITQSIGTNSRDFSTVQAWEDALPVDFVALGNSYVGVMHPDSEFISTGGLIVTIAGQTTSAECTLTLRAAPGTGFHENANVRTNPLYYNAAAGVGIRMTGSGYGELVWIDTKFVTLEGLQIEASHNGKPLRVSNLSGNFTGRNLILLGGGSFGRLLRIQGSGNLLQNVLVVKKANAGSGTTVEFAGGTIENSTIVKLSSDPDKVLQGDYQTMTVRNTAILGVGGFTPRGGIAAASTNNATSDASAPGTNPLNNIALADCFVNATNDYRLKAGAPLINAGATAGRTTDISGTARPQGASYDIGAWEYVEQVDTVPSAPTGVTATAGPGPGQATVSFTPNGNGGQPITGYTVTSSSGQTANGTASPIVVSGLPNNTAITFTAQAINSIGPSAASAPSNSITLIPDTTKPQLVSAVATTGDTIVLTFDELLGDVTPTVSDFTLSAAPPTGITRSSNKITLLGFSTAYAYGQTITLSYAKPAAGGLQDTAGNRVDSFGPVTVTNNIPNRPSLPGYTLKLYGDDPLHDFSTAAALCNYIRGLSLDDTMAPVMIYCYKTLDLTGQWNIGPNVSTVLTYVTVRPAPGLSYEEIEPEITASNLGTEGLILIGNNSATRVGCIYEGWRVNNSSGTMTFRRDNWGNNGDFLGFRKCRLNITTDQRPFTFGEYGCAPRFEDCLVVHNSPTYAGVLAHSTGGGIALRSTFVRLGNTANTSPMTSGSRFNEIRDCLFFDMGDDPNQGASGSHNYTNKPIAATAVNLTYVSGAFFTSASDYRPAEGSPMVGGGSEQAVSKNDNHGNNRGLTPDAGATQRVPAMPLPTGLIVQQFPIDGQTLKITLSTTNNPTSGKITLTPDNPPNGASAVGPLDLVLTTNAGSVEIDDIPPGNYLAPTITLTNAGGTVFVPGAKKFDVAGFGNLVYDGGGVGTGGGGTDPVVTIPPPTIAITTAATAIMAGKRATFSGSVNLNGDPNGQVNTFADPQPSGTPIALGAANVASTTWTKQADLLPGLYKLRVVATSNGQTATAMTGDIRVLNLTGNFNLPAA